MNAFDLIVTIALGSILAAVMLTKSVALADGVLAFFLLIMLQFVITFLSVRINWFNDLVKSTPPLLVYNGKMVHERCEKKGLAKTRFVPYCVKRGFLLSNRLLRSCWKLIAP